MHRTKWKPLVKKLPYIFPTVMALGAALCLLYTVWSHNFYRDREFNYYIGQFGLNGRFVSGDDVIAQLGNPEEIRYFFRNDDPKDQLDYILLNYGAYDFGILGDSVEGTIVKIGVKAPGIIHLRGSLDIGSDKNEADRVYRYERIMKGEYGFILGKDHVIADGGGIWISLNLDEEEKITNIVITDGL
ncbi:hypothetical protein [Hungatella sp. SB206]|uniref:hypothetical protein n=1 Tax=Hungatella sp. SB206 TaxID=2937758 RepID=UPI003DA7B169